MQEARELRLNAFFVNDRQFFQAVVDYFIETPQLQILDTYYKDWTAFLDTFTHEDSYAPRKTHRKIA